MKKILITGGAGFIGSNFIPYFLEKYPNDMVFNLDALTYAGDLENLDSISSQSNYQFIQGDISDRDFVNSIFEAHQFTDVIHFAAESHVDNSITGPAAFVKTNINGTFNLLDAARNLWMSAPNVFNFEYKNSVFHHISTDEVYGTLGSEGLFTESTPYAPNSPYSASKAASDLLVRSYYHTYGMQVKTTNCSNNYGPKQHDEKLIPTIIRKCVLKEPIPIYGTGTNVRDWLYVMDHCKGIDLVFKSGKVGETYNIGGKNERTNIYIAETICSLLNEMLPVSNFDYNSLITYVADRPGHDQRYAIDASKLENELGWIADENFETGLRKTLSWYLDKYKKQTLSKTI
ncbi:MAG: dTDP-glucose 4,6-dehydratase [Flavobacterium sp.]|nr:dTDP-glucose 4,6-dehydratase [Candidatus Neoflavobacterium equi]